MKQVYYVERKAYLKSIDGCEYQIADGGVLPELFSSRHAAQSSMDFTREFRVKEFGDRIVRDGVPSNLQCSGLLDEFELVDDKTEVRIVYSLYKVIVR